MTFWTNLVGYQLVWFALVMSAARGHTGWAMLVGAIFVVSQLLTAVHAAADCRLLLLAVALGVVVDGVLSGTGWLRYASPAPALPAHGAPLWILMLWACFATTLNRSLSWLRSRPWMAALVGAVGAPFAYLGAARGWDAVQFVHPPLALAWLAIGWAVALSLLSECADRWRVSARERGV